MDGGTYRICALRNTQTGRGTNKSQSNHKVSRSDLKEFSRKRHLQQGKENSQHVLPGSPGIFMGEEEYGVLCDNTKIIFR